MSSPPAAAGVRLPWAGLPERIRSAVEARAGAAVIAARDQRGGFSPGVAARLVLDDGSRLFVKAVAFSVNSDSAGMHRDEARTLATLPPGVPAPRLRWTYDDGDWIILGIEDVEGHSPALPWRRDDLERVIAALPATPAPEGFVSLTGQLAGAFTGWRTLAAEPPADLDRWALRHLDRLAALEASWPGHADGGMLLHSDLRADNLIIGTDGGIHLVDWAHACSGAPWVDLTLLLTEVDRSLVDPDEILSEAGAPPEGVDALLCVRGIPCGAVPATGAARPAHDPRVPACLRRVRDRLAGPPHRLVTAQFGRWVSPW
jgi:aminoglycoside phosphotransferase (APT) family kinase protein